MYNIDVNVDNIYRCHSNNYIFGRVNIDIVYRPIFGQICHIFQTFYLGIISSWFF